MENERDKISKYLIDNVLWYFDSEENMEQTSLEIADYIIEREKQIEAKAKQEGRI